jgi:hypothetical protein
VNALADWDLNDPTVRMDCVDKEVAGAEEKIAPLLAGLLTWGITEASKWVVSKSDSVLKSWVDSYTGAPKSGVRNVNFYGVLQPSSQKKTSQKTLCFRLSSFEAVSKDPKKPRDDLTFYLTGDFIGKAVIDLGADDGTRAMVTILPVRFFYTKTTVKSEFNQGKRTKDVAVETHLSADSVSLGMFSGVSASQVINVSLGTERFAVDENGYVAAKGDQTAKSDDDSSVAGKKVEFRDFSDGRHAVYVTYSGDERPSMTVPLPPWDSGNPAPAIGQNGTTGSLSAKVSFTEAGNVPWLLAHVQSLFHDNTDSLSQSMAKVVDAKLNPQESQSK